MADVKIVFNAAEDYERFMGRWSRAIGEQFLNWVRPSKNARWLDVGCGTGAFSELIIKRCAPASVNGIDPSPEQIAYAKKTVSGFATHALIANKAPSPAWPRRKGNRSCHRLRSPGAVWQSPR